MMLNHPIDLVRVSEIALQSFFLDVRRLVADLVAPFPLEFEKKKRRKIGTTNESSEDDLDTRDTRKKIRNINLIR